MQKAVFLDRDGTVARDVPYCSRPDDFSLLPKAAQAIRLLNESGFKVVLITNQSGVGRGYFTEETLAGIHRKMEDDLKAQGARLDAVYYCPHHPDDACGCRKPNTGLLQQAAADMDIDAAASYMVGDMPLDIDAGKAFGCRTVLVLTGPAGGSNVATPPDYTAKNLLEAAQWIIQ